MPGSLTELLTLSGLPAVMGFGYLLSRRKIKALRVTGWVLFGLGASAGITLAFAAAAAAVAPVIQDLLEISRSTNVDSQTEGENNRPEPLTPALPEWVQDLGYPVVYNASAEQVIIWLSPDISGQIIARLDPDVILPATGRTATGDWIQVDLPDGFATDRGWVWSGDVILSGDPNSLPVADATIPSSEETGSVDSGVVITVPEIVTAPPTIGNGPPNSEGSPPSSNDSTASPGDGSVIISGNGPGSQNSVIREVTESTVIQSTNSAVVNNTIVTSADTGGCEAPCTTGDASASTTVTNDLNDTTIIIGN